MSDGGNCAEAERERSAVSRHSKREIERCKRIASNMSVGTGKAKAHSLDRTVGHTYVFMREGHDWHGSEVTLISKDKTGCVVTLATATWKALVTQAASQLGRPFALVVTQCTEGELW